MAKANITTPDGTTINLEGTADEVAALVAKFGLITKAAATVDVTATNAPIKSAGAKPKPKSRGNGKAGVQAVVNEMIDDGYFKHPKVLGVVRTELEQSAHFYSRPAVGGALLRAVKGKKLRRIKQNGNWAYVV